MVEPNPGARVFQTYTDADYERIFPTIPRPEGMNLAGLERALAQTAWRYRLELAMELHVVKNAEVRRQLSAVQAALSSLAVSLEELHPDVRADILRAGDTCWHELEAQLERLNGAVGSAVDGMAAIKRPGRRRSPSLRRYVDAVILIWEGFTGDRAGYTQDPYASDQRERGPFLDFAEAVAKPILGSLFTRSLFVESLKRRRREERALG